jgi:hypothetical protein
MEELYITEENELEIEGLPDLSQIEEINIDFEN